MSLIGIDIGTTGCKVAAFDLEGRCLHLAYRAYPTLREKPGRAELDTVRVLELVTQALAQTVSSTRADPPTALCIGAMGEAAAPVDARGRPLGRAILSADTRGGEYARILASEVGEERLYAINPNRPSAAYTMPKLCWMRDHQPRLYRAASGFLLWDGLVAARLGCAPFVSRSLANRTLLFDLRSGTWSQQLLQVAGLTPEKLPPCLAAGVVAGEVGSRAAAELGLPAGVKIVVGGHDQCINALGAGVCTPGRAVDGLGTYECLTPVYERVPDLESMRRAGLNVEHHVVPGQYVSFIFNQAGGLIAWFMRTFARDLAGVDDRFARLELEMPARPTGILILPHFEPTGAPDYIADSCGAVVGLTSITSRGEIYRGLLESISYYFAAALDRLQVLGVEPGALVATGGGAASDAWLQIKADIYGLPLQRPACSECGVMGAAMLAGAGTGVLPSLSRAVQAWVKPGTVFQPRPEEHGLYRRRLERYLELASCLRAPLAAVRELSL